MVLFKYLPEVQNCCGCVTDLKTAAAIIAVLGIVTSPALSWAVVRHSYVIRVSCHVTTSSKRPDILDINLNNILTFGFGANAGLGPSCLASHSEKTPTNSSTPAPGPVPPEPASEASNGSSIFIGFVKTLGWIILIVDLAFLLTSVYFLIQLFKPEGNGTNLSVKDTSEPVITKIGVVQITEPAPSSRYDMVAAAVQSLRYSRTTQSSERGKNNELSAASLFMILALVSMTLSFIYGLIFVSSCLVVGGAFPLFEFFFSIFDLIIWIIWAHFILVINSFIKEPQIPSRTQRIRNFVNSYIGKNYTNI